MAVFEEALKYFPDIPDGITMSPVKGVHYFKESFHKGAEPSVYPAGLCVMLSGSKILTMEDVSFKYTGGEYVVCSMTMPLRCEICADKDEPVKGIFIGFTVSEIRSLVDIMSLRDATDNIDIKTVPNPFGPSVMSESFRGSIVRFLECLRNEQDAMILGEALKREVLYRALTGEQSDLLFKIALNSGPLALVSNIIGIIQSNYNQDLDVNKLADDAHLSVSSFYRIFRQITSDTPIQYIKKLRLNRARDLIVSKNVKAYVAAFEVGYESVSQFSREFKRYFGVTPAAFKGN